MTAMNQPRTTSSSSRSRHGGPRTRILTADLKRLALMSNHWFSQYGDNWEFPDNYTTIDIETDGVSPEKCFICMIGHTVVRDRQIVSTNETYLDWTSHPDVDQDKLRETLLNTQRAMERQGKHFGHTYAQLQAVGQDPIGTLQHYLDLFEEMENRHEVLLAHNGWRFDVEFFQSHFHNWLGVAFTFMDELVYDTGVCEKASQLAATDQPFPLDGETMRQWAFRVGGLRRKGIMWALDKHCEERYKLTDKMAADGLTGIDHAAGYDSQKLFYLFEEHRALAGLADQVQPGLDPQAIVEE
jgi:hypothetical protein